MVLAETINFDACSKDTSKYTNLFSTINKTTVGFGVGTNTFIVFFILFLIKPRFLVKTNCPNSFSDTLKEPHFFVYYHFL